MGSGGASTGVDIIKGIVFDEAADVGEALWTDLHSGDSHIVLSCELPQPGQRVAELFIDFSPMAETASGVSGEKVDISLTFFSAMKSLQFVTADGSGGGGVLALRGLPTVLDRESMGDSR